MKCIILTMNRMMNEIPAKAQICAFGMVRGGNGHVWISDSIFTANRDLFGREIGPLSNVIRVFYDFLGFRCIVAILAKDVFDTTA